MSQVVMSAWVIYDHPRDYPNHYVIRGGTSLTVCRFLFHTFLRFSPSLWKQLARMCQRATSISVGAMAMMQ